MRLRIARRAEGAGTCRDNSRHVHAIAPEALERIRGQFAPLRAPQTVSGWQRYRGQCFSRRILRSSRGDRDAKAGKWYDVLGKIITVPRGAYIRCRNKLEIITELCYTVNVIKISAPRGRGGKGRKCGMNRRIITQSELAGFSEMLRREERSGGTSEKYMRDVRALALWLDGREVSASAVSAWKEQLLHAG